MVSDIKRASSAFVPYKHTNNGIKIYLQKRTKEAKRNPNMFGFWGGGLEEGETPEEAMLREVKEELNYTPSSYNYFSKYGDGISETIKYIYCEEIKGDFEDKIMINEGHCGKFFNEQEIESEPTLVKSHRVIIKELFKYIATL